MYKQISFLPFSSSKFSVQVPFQQETTFVFPLVLLRASLIAQLVKNLLAMQETLVRFLGQEDPWRRDRLPTPVSLDFPCDSAGKESACNVGDLGLILGLGRSPGEGKDYPLQYSGLENSVGLQRVGHN